ncbi:MAG TPA: Gfo/Idh/MocA family oxidoreductase [Acidimicrobiales bacterium]|nr:Gfo/Idh/MocA family oxidoreductase [Acidimicrobiales bacterium]
MSSSSAGPPVLGFGIVGAGVISETYAAALAGVPGAALVAVTDVDAERAAKFAAQHAVPDAGSLEQLLARPDVEVVCVCVPSGQHAEIGLAAARAGRHVVCEKPIDISLAPARDLIDGARAAGVSLTVISQQRYNPGVQRAKALIDQGRLGRLVEVSASVAWWRSQAYYDSAGWRGTWALDGGGAFMNQGVHYADLVCWLCGPPEVLSATCAAVAHDIDVEDVALALLRFGDGALGVLEATTCAYPGYKCVLRVSGTGGTVVLEDGALVSAELQDGDETATTGAMSGDVGALKTPELHRAQLADVVSAISTGRPPSVSGEDGYRALQFVLDVYAAAGWGPQKTTVLRP